MGCQCMRDEIKSQKQTQLTLHELYYPIKSKRSTVVTKSKQALTNSNYNTYESKSDHATDLEYSGKISHTKATNKLNIEGFNEIKIKEIKEESNYVTVVDTNDNQETLDFKNIDITKLEQIKYEKFNEVETINNGNLIHIDKNSKNKEENMENTSNGKQIRSPNTKEDNSSNNIIFNELNSNNDIISINKQNDEISELEGVKNSNNNDNNNNDKKNDTTQVNEVRLENSILTLQNINPKRNISRLTLQPNNFQHNNILNSSSDKLATKPFKKQNKEIDFTCKKVI